MPEINAGDTAWLLMATALVMVMLPGLALFYGGLVRRKNVLSTVMHSFFGLALVSVVWVVIGFTLAFGPDVAGLGLIGGRGLAPFHCARPRPPGAPAPPPRWQHGSGARPDVGSRSVRSNSEPSADQTQCASGEYT